MPLESCYVLSPKPCIVVINMNTRKDDAKRVEEEMENMGAQDDEVPPQDNQVLSLEEVAMGDQVTVVPPPMIDGEHQ